MNYTKQDYERDKEIVANAPDGSDEFFIHNGDVNYIDNHENGHQFKLWCENDGWVFSELVDGWQYIRGKRSLQDIRDKIALYEANQKLIAAIGESIKDRCEQYDHSYHVYCNFCDGNLTKSKGVHDDDCILKELTND